MAKTKRLPAYFRLILIFSAGALQTLSLSPFDLWYAAPISIALFIAATGALLPAQKKKRSAFFEGWLLGFGLFSSGASWVYVSIHTYGHAPPFLAGILTLLFVAGLGLFHGLFFAVFNHFKSNKFTINALLFSALWVLNDVFRGFFLTGFPWLYLGDSQLTGPLNPLIPVIGVHGVTLTIALFASLAIAAIYQGRPQQQATAIGLVIFLPLLAFSLKQVEWVEDSGNQLNIAAIQTNIAQEDKWKSSQRPKTLRLLEDMTAPHWEKDVIFWPETAIPILYSSAGRVIELFSEAARKTNTAIVTGIPYRGWDTAESSFVLHNSIMSMGAGSGLYHKQKLVPFGEYVPLQHYLRGLIAFFDLPMSDFRKGPPDQELLKTAGFSVAPFICYEVVYPDFVANQSVGADYLVTISNDAWFGESIGPLQHLQLARMRALENGRFMVRATNNGVTAIINHRGEITAVTPQFARNTLTGKVKIMSGRTPFSRFGSWPVIITALCLVFYAFLKRRKASNTVTPTA